MFLYISSGAIQEPVLQHGQTEMVFRVTMDKNVQDQIHVKMVNAKESVLLVTIFANTAMATTAVFIRVTDMLRQNAHVK